MWRWNRPLRHAVHELAEQAAAEVAAQLPGQRVEVVLHDGDPALRVTTEDATTDSAAEYDYEARITLRLPERLKQLIEESAGASGDSINSWVVKTVSSHVNVRRAAALSVDYHVEIEVDGSPDVEVKSVSADTRVTAPVGSVRIETASGDVAVDAATDDVDLRTASGDIMIGACDGRTRLRTTSGDVRIARASGGVSAVSASGDVHIDEAGDAVAVKTASSLVLVGRFNGHQFNAKTVSVDIRLGVPRGRAVTVESRRSPATCTFRPNPNRHRALSRDREYGSRPTQCPATSSSPQPDVPDALFRVPRPRSVA